MAHGFSINEVNVSISLSNIGRPVLDKGTSVITFTATATTTTTTTATAATIFQNLSILVKLKQP